jgi:hypothetical protein
MEIIKGMVGTAGVTLPAAGAKFLFPVQFRYFLAGINCKEGSNDSDISKQQGVAF